MNCPRCQIPLSRHDNWCGKCNTYYSGSYAAPAPNPIAPVESPQAPWDSGTPASHPAMYQSPAYMPPPQTSASHRGRFMIGGMSLGTIAVLLRGLNLIYHTQQDYSDKAARNARAEQNFQQAAGQAQTTGDGGVGGFIQAHDASRAAIQNQQEQSRQQQQQIMQMQMQQQAETNRRMQAQQAAMHAMNQPAFTAPAPAMQPMQPMGQSGFRPMEPMSGGSHFSHP